MASAIDGKPPFRAEVIGSLLRPRRLKDAGRAMQEGRLSAVDYQELLEAEIADVIARQEDIGLPVVTDGELARSSWFGFFFEGIDGFVCSPPLQVQGRRRLRLRVADMRGHCSHQPPRADHCSPSSSVPTDT